MPTFALTNAIMHIGGYDMSGDLNEVKLTVDAETKDVTTFGSQWQSRVIGLRSAQISAHGYWQAGTGMIDPATFPSLGALEVVIIGATATAGDVAYLGRLRKCEYSHGAAIGDVYAFDVTAHGADGVGMVRGRLAVAKQNVSATGPVGSVLNLGAGTGKRVYGALHAFSAGTSITVQVQSDDHAGFTSPTTVATFTGGAITTTGGYWLTPTTGTADNHFRINVSAITGAWQIAAAIGVQ